MKSAKETLSPTRVKLTVEVPFDELEPTITRTYKTIGSQIQVPGFRKGKVPNLIIDQRVGREYVLSEAVNEALPGLYSQALGEAEIVPLGQPELDVEDPVFGEPLTFTAELDVRPDIELPDLSDLSVEVEDAVVTDEDLENEIQALRERFAELNAVDRPAADGDHVIIDLSASKDGEEIAAAQASDLPYQIGKATMLEGLDEAVIGLSKGESKVFQTQLAGGELAGQDVDVEVTVSDVKEATLPETDDEFAQTASEFDTVAELRDDLRERLTRGKRIEQAETARNQVLDEIVSRVDAPLPEQVVADEISGRKEQITQQLTYAGMTLEDYLDNESQTIDEFEAELEKSIRDSLVAQFVLDEIVSRDEIGIENDELMQHMMRRAQESGQDPQGYIQHAVEHNHLPELMGEVLRGKALATLVEGADVRDKSGAPVDLKNLRGDGSIADPDAEDAEEVGEVETEAQA